MGMLRSRYRRRTGGAGRVDLTCTDVRRRRVHEVGELRRRVAHGVRKGLNVREVVSFLLLLLFMRRREGKRARV
jgi:hypothetical protein